VYYILIRLAILPLVVGIGYEFIMFAGKHDNFLIRMLSAPGLWVQRITTKEPTLDMLEVAIVSTKCALRDEIPEFMEFYNARGWETPAVVETEDTDVSDEEATPETDESIEEVTVLEVPTTETTLTETLETPTESAEDGE
jgi:hypothetical protein